MSIILQRDGQKWSSAAQSGRLTAMLVPRVRPDTAISGADPIRGRPGPDRHHPTGPRPLGGAVTVVGFRAAVAEVGERSAGLAGADSPGSSTVVDPGAADSRRDDEGPCRSNTGSPTARLVVVFPWEAA
jgi:hypothetical protein